jgi:hypothetical protein
MKNNHLKNNVETLWIKKFKISKKHLKTGQGDATGRTILKNGVKN